MDKYREAIDEEPNWVQEALAGSKQAFGRLVERYERSVYAFLLSRTRDKDLAQELSQETFVRAYEGLSRFDESQRFQQWVLGIAHHVGAEWLRQEQRRQKATEGLKERQAPGSSGRFGVGEGGGEKKGKGSEIAKRILAAIEDCPESYRLPLALRYLDQLPYDEIAEELHLSENQIKGLLYRGKKLLKKKLAGLWEDTP